MSPDDRAARVAALDSWHADWAGLVVAVLGAGVTGFAAADTLRELGCAVTVVGTSVDPQRADLLDVIGARVAVATPDEQPAALAAIDPDLVIASPGFHPDAPPLVWAAEQGVPVLGDIDLAWRLRDARGPAAEWITVTGTNGKTTTTRLVTAMLVAAGRRAVACGNIGKPVLDAVRDPDGYDVLVVELSSYQLHWVSEVSPLASACLNIAEDHIDWHGSAAAYRAAKGRVYERTRIACVYNVEDEATRELVEAAEVVDGARAIGFGRGVPRVAEVGVVDGLLVDRAYLADRQRAARELASIDDLEAADLAAPHLVADVLAAAALALAAGIPPTAVRPALATFRLDPHRVERVREVDGVTWIDDSKATNPHAADASLTAFPRVVWIAGGLTKGVDVAPLVEAHADRLAGVVLIGVDAGPFETALARHAASVPVVRVDPGETGRVMTLAVAAARSLASPGDVVLLAPAAASMDQFTDYSARGDAFRAAVETAG